MRLCACRKDGHWKYGLKTKGVQSPCVQIRHAGDNHWIMSFQDESSETVYVVDNMLGNKCERPTSMEMQLTQIYGKGTGKLKVSFLQVQQQDNTVDCDIFAIAYCTEFCFTGKAKFDRMRMRQHLLN